MAVSDEIYSDGADDVIQQSSDAERAAELSRSSSDGGTRARRDTSSSGSSDGGGAGTVSKCLTNVDAFAALVKQQTPKRVSVQSCINNCWHRCSLNFHKTDL